MRWDQLGTSNFLAFDVGLDIRQAASLVHEFSPTYLVLFDAGQDHFETRDSDYYFVTSELFEWDQATAPDEGVTIKDYFELRFWKKAEVVDMESDPVLRQLLRVTPHHEVVVLGLDGAVASVVPNLGDEVSRAMEAARVGVTQKHSTSSAQSEARVSNTSKSPVPHATAARMKVPSWPTVVEATAVARAKPPRTR